MKTLFCLLAFFIGFPMYAQVADLYKDKGCVSCHGAQAEGNIHLKSPALAGQNYAYLIRQLQNFQNQTRGEHKADYTGKTMWGMASALSASEMEQIAQYLSELPPTKQDNTVSGFADKGKPFYLACISCHGENAEGNDELNAPNLVVLQDWYIVEQLKKFKATIRGGNLDLNPIATQMMPMAMTLPTEEEMEDLSLYIKSLPLQ